MIRCGILLLAVGLVSCSEATVPLDGILPLAFAPTRDNPICAIMEVVDGDTITVRCRDGVDQNVRLTGFDTPETFRSGCAAEKALGTKAKERLSKEIRAAEVISIEYEGKGRYGRPLGEMVLDGVPVAETLVTAGVALPYTGGRRVNWCDQLLQAT